MFRYLHHRAGHYGLLILAAAGMILINLGGPSLWEIDESNNAECAREMLESENWVVPLCNYRLRVDKPVLLYWLQIAAYQQFGVNEFSARLPSALSALLAILLTYELGRRMFGASVGLLAGLVLASMALFCASAHFANPDALLNALTLLTLFTFWVGYTSGWRGWFVPAAALAGLAALAKGPVGVLLPGAVVVLFLFASRRLRVLLDGRLLLGAVTLLLVAAPWYAWVSEQTKNEFILGFLLTHNVGRFLSPMQSHGGPIYYYLVVLMLGYLPWSVFLVPACWDAVRTLKTEPRDSTADSRPAVRLLCGWIVVYMVFYSLSQTKLPNYILPISVPLALLTARFLDRWRLGIIAVPGWVLMICLAWLALMGVGFAVALLWAGGAIEAPFASGQRFPGLERWAAVGLLPLLGAAAAGWYLRRQKRNAVVAVCTITSLLLLGILGANVGMSLEAHKGPKALARVIGADQTEREVCIGAYEYFQPSLIFYCQRRVEWLRQEGSVQEFLFRPLPVYLLIPAEQWQRIEATVQGPYRLVGRHRDLYFNCDVVVVTNR